MKRVLILVALIFGACGYNDYTDKNIDSAWTGDLSGLDLIGIDLAGYVNTPPDMAINNPRNINGLGPEAINLGSSSTYVILAKTGITNVTGSNIVGGNLGVSPIGSTAITGFALVPDPSNIFSTSYAVPVPGKIYAANYSPPTPTNLTTDVLAMQASYTDGASRTPPDFINLENGELGGLTLAPGLYTFGSSVSISTDVIFSGGTNDVWILQISKDLFEAAAKNVILAGGARAKNIFWIVAGEATIAPTAHFEGIILSMTGCTLQTTASFVGRILCQSLVALDNNSITAP
jgi:hypothetical protein